MEQKKKLSPRMSGAFPQSRGSRRRSYRPEQRQIQDDGSDLFGIFPESFLNSIELKFVQVNLSVPITTRVIGISIQNTFSRLWQSDIFPKSTTVYSAFQVEHAFLESQIMKNEMHSHSRLSFGSSHSHRSFHMEQMSELFIPMKATKLSAYLISKCKTFEFRNVTHVPLFPSDFEVENKFVVLSPHVLRT